MQNPIGGGYAPRRFGLLTGILTLNNSFDARLYKDYRQFAGTTLDGDKQPDGKSDNGDYP